MSHFGVLVVGDDLDSQMAPFFEQGEPGSEYMEFEDQTDEWKEEFENKTTEAVWVKGKWEMPWHYKSMVESKKAKAGLQEETVPLKKIYGDFETFANDWHGATPNDDGQYGYWSNPNAKWDWWQLGGRWHGFFWKKPNSKTGKSGDKSWCNEKESFHERQVDQLKKGDVDVDAMRNHDLAEWSKTWDKAQEMEAPQREFIYGVKGNETKEEFIERLKRKHPCQVFAVLWNGEWIEKGSMGWWGIVSDEKDPDAWTNQFTRIWNKIPNDATISIVDCHI